MSSIKRHVWLLCFLLAACGTDSLPTNPDPNGVLPDNTPPSQVVAPELCWNDTSDVATLSWLAPQNDGEAASRYEIRYGYAFPFDWSISVAAALPPDPALPGTRQTYDITSPDRGRDLYAAIRSFDTRGNASLVSDVAHVRITGYSLNLRCEMVGGGGGVPGLDVAVTARRVVQLTTDTNGAASVANLAGMVHVAIRAGQSPTPWHHIDDVFQIHDNASPLYLMIEFAPTVSPAYSSVLHLFLSAAQGLGRDGIFRRYASLPVAVHVPPLVNTHGIDYAARTIEAIDRWELRTGVDLFEVVASVPAVGVEFRFLPPSQMGGHNGITERINDANEFPLRDVVRVIDTMADAAQLYRILLHELGHTIRLNHLPSGNIMYGGQPLPNDIHDDEAACVVLHSLLPSGIDISVYDPAQPNR